MSDENTPDPGVDPAEDPALRPEGAVGPEDLRKDLASEHGTAENGDDRDHLGDEDNGVVSRRAHQTSEVDEQSESD